MNNILNWFTERWITASSFIVLVLIVIVSSLQLSFCVDYFECQDLGMSFAFLSYLFIPILAILTSVLFLKDTIWFTRIKFIIISLAMAGVIFAFSYPRVYSFCEFLGLNFDSSCSSAISGVLGSFALAFPIFIFVCVSFFLDKEVSRFWANMTVVWMIVFTLIVLLSPYDNGGSGWWPSPSTREAVLYLGFMSYILTSIDVIIAKSLLARWKEDEVYQKVKSPSKQRVITMWIVLAVLSVILSCGVFFGLIFIG